jgi:anti-sigma factor RsiW
MRNPFQRHCSDAQLIAHADGELSTIAAGFVNRHLGICPECRKIRQQLGSEAQRIAKALRQDMLVDAARADGARNRFIRWRRLFENYLLTGILPERGSERIARPPIHKSSNRL